ncbi:hypothetical protein Nepgr_010574 [Nepenthes gracilis]|uniref:Dephospho-CoA kinase n=1 Tax=Nepenthes gracilis TaxID=150966 RepID=A0AAD3SDL7_NEPGR|nr:hypothetical protein Nepgr_010574 [Nepenthes gracilis]
MSISGMSSGIGIITSTLQFLFLCHVTALTLILSSTLQITNHQLLSSSQSNWLHAYGDAFGRGHCPSQNDTQIGLGGRLIRRKRRKQFSLIPDKAMEPTDILDLGAPLLSQQDGHSSRLYQKFQATVDDDMVATMAGFWGWQNITPNNGSNKGIELSKKLIQETKAIRKLVREVIYLDTLGVEVWRSYRKNPRVRKWLGLNIPIKDTICFLRKGLWCDNDSILVTSLEREVPLDVRNRKSTASNLFKANGVPIVDADIVARNILKKGTDGWKKVVEAFGEGIVQPNGEVDRPKLGQIVFSDPTKRQLLNRILAPYIANGILWEVLKLWLKGCKVIVLDIPLLFEAKMDKWTKPIIVIWVDHETQLQRLMARDGVSHEEATNKINAQMPLDLKRNKADIVIDNTGSLDDLNEQFQKVLSVITKPLTWSEFMLSRQGAFSVLALVAIGVLVHKMLTPTAKL